ncbi:MAG: extracellular solute-binding protein [Anaerolineales bacterium]
MGIFVLLLAFLGGCAGVAAPVQDDILVQELTPTPPESLAFPAADDEPEGPLTLRVWVPPEFDPSSGTPASGLLQVRLDEFVLLHPGARIDVRVKAAAGPGGILDSLRATQAIAPGALPDLVALPRPALESAAASGLLYPFDEFKFVREDTDWYGFAQEMASVHDAIFGIPFAGDALVLLYRPEAIGDPPKDWTTTQQQSSILLFPAASPQSLFTVALYQAAKGEIQDEQGRPTVNPATLAAVFKFYSTAQKNGVMPPLLTKYATEESVLQDYKRGAADLAVTWVSGYLGNPEGETAVSGLPTPGGVPFTLITGWMWALSNPSSTHQDLSVELAQFLTDSVFLSQWTNVGGYLPPRPTALAGWPESPGSALASRIVLSARVIPSADVLDSLGPAMQQATIDLLNGEVEPAEAANSVARRLGIPLE